MKIDNFVNFRTISILCHCIISSVTIKKGHILQESNFAMWLDFQKCNILVWEKNMQFHNFSHESLEKLTKKKIKFIQYIYFKIYINT